MTKTLGFSKVSTRIFAGVIAVAAFAMCVPFITNAAMLYRQLEVGMTGADVSDLQTFLASDPTIYPSGKVTGYFGALTKSAVMNFQVRNGISSVGRVGPATLAAINAKMNGGGTVSTGQAPLISGVAVSPSSNSVIINWNTNEATKGVVYYSTTPLVTYERATSVDVSGATAMTDSNFRASQSVAISSLASNTTYYYMVYTTDLEGNVSVTVPSFFRTL
jgi:peptidoglycan hydrolase-like protein with peptidoglycan-binding domain